MRRSVAKAISVGLILLLLIPIGLGTGAAAVYGWLNYAELIREHGLWIFCFVFGILNLLFLAVLTILVRDFRNGFASPQIRSDAIWFPGALWSSEIPLSSVVCIYQEADGVLKIQTTSGIVNLEGWFFIQAEMDDLIEAFNRAEQQRIASSRAPLADGSVN